MISNILMSVSFFLLLMFPSVAFSQDLVSDLVANVEAVNDIANQRMEDTEALIKEATNDFKTATAKIAGTSEDSTVNGDVTLTEVPEGLQIQVVVNNVPNPGTHGFHIHENGSCGEKGAAAGGHFNPKVVDHGLLPKDGPEHAHGGDMGNIEVDAAGHGELNILLPGVNLSHGEFNVAGKAVILHEKADDFGQPTGNAGGRIGCGIITLPENTETGGQ